MRWTALNALVAALCTYRLALLVGRDEILSPLRDRLVGDEGRVTSATRPRLQAFIECPWCTSIWLAIGVVVLTHFYWLTVRWGCYVLALSAVAGFLSERS